MYIYIYQEVPAVIDSFCDIYIYDIYTYLVWFGMIHSSNSLTLQYPKGPVIRLRHITTAWLLKWWMLLAVARPTQTAIGDIGTALQMDMDNISNICTYMKKGRPSMFGTYIWDYMLIHLENGSCILDSATCKLYQRSVWWSLTFGIFISFSRKTLHLTNLIQLKKNGTTYNFEVVADVSFGLAFIKEQWLWRSLLRHSCLA